MPKGTPVSFYDSDPSTGQAHLLAGAPWYLPDTLLGMCCNYAYTIKLGAGKTGLNVLYAVLNDSGNTSPLHLPNTPIQELNYANNIVSASNFQFQLAMAPLDTTVMRKTSFPFRVTGTNGETFSLVWSPGPGYNLSCTNCPAPLVQAMDSSLVRVEATTQYGCTAFDSTLVYIFPPDLTVQVNGADCYTNDSLLVHFTICMNNGYDSVWAGIPVSFAGGLDSFVTPAAVNGSCAQYVMVIPKPGGDTLFVLVNQSGVIPETDMTNDGNAFSLTPFQVSIQPGDTSVPMGSLLTLSLSSSGGTTGGISWYPVNDLSCSDCLSPELTVPFTQQYRAIVRNQYSCIDTAYAFIKAFTGGEVNIPSAFSPNGDGKNDIFYIMGGKNVLSIQHLAIFSRYGSVVFQSDNSLPNDPSQGWDGTSGGHEAPPGTYVYMAIINFAEGRQQLYKGTVVLLR
jgi:gliding motility-associated-like protein